MAPKFVVLAFFLIGCSMTMANDCDSVAFTACTTAYNDAGIDKEDPCASKSDMETFLSCLNAVLKNAECPASNDTISTIAGTIKQLEQTLDVCKAAAEGGSHQGPSSCSSAALQVCSGMLKQVNPGMGPESLTAGNVTAPSKNESAPMPTGPMPAMCGTMNSAAQCLYSALANCQEKTMKAEVEKMLGELQKQMEDHKCCDTVAIQKCMTKRYTITNDTATRDTCSMLRDDKPCVEKKLKACEDKSVRKTFEDSIATQVAICESKGYTGSGTTTRPAVVIVLASGLAAMLALF